MVNRKNPAYFIGMDIGTNSIGYAVTTEDYRLIKYQQHPMWGVHLFDSAQNAAVRRSFRTARRRLARRRQRIHLLRELFANEIANIDPGFFQRIDASALKKKPGEVPYAVFADSGYTDRDFHKQYPTIHHLIAELIDSQAAHDVRLVYLACAWLLAHRGHFFSDVDREKVDEILSFANVYGELERLLGEWGMVFPWKNKSGIDTERIGKILASSVSRSEKAKQLAEYLQVGKKDTPEDFPFNPNEFLRMLCGLEGKLKTLFGKEEYEAKLSLASEDEKIAEVCSSLDEDDASLILGMKKIFDWLVLADIMRGSRNLSLAKVRIYERHAKDLKDLKQIFKTYLSADEYDKFFRSGDADNYAAYISKKTDLEKFYKHLKSKLASIRAVSPEDQGRLQRIDAAIQSGSFLPKQVVSDNRTIPYQLYWNELRNLLKQASGYLPFLVQKDADGLSVREKILSIMEFRIPYFVGPLNAKSPFAWFKRKAEGRILPWNFDEKVDLDGSEELFIKRMTNCCTYLPGEPVLPKDSLLYQRFEVLNLINNITANGLPVSVECKQRIYDLFRKYKKVSKKTIANFLKSSNIYPGIDENSISGIDETVTASLASWNFFQPFLDAKKLTFEEAEQIISKRTFTADQKRFRTYLRKFSLLTPSDIARISAKNFQGFGRLSAKFLTTPQYFHAKSGCELSIINMMWECNLNLQQLMSERYPFAKMVADAKREYYANIPSSLTERLDAMYVSNAVKRPISRAMTVIVEIVRTMGCAPARIFVEMARDVTNGKKGKRTVSRFTQLLKLYQDIADEDARKLSAELAKYDENALQKDTLYLYFMQLGRDMYTGEAITDLSLYNKEHIYPQSKIKDDSLLNNMVLVRSEVNGQKKDDYPISGEIRARMTPFWKGLLEKKLITAEKFSRLTRSLPFSEDEKWGFINRQLVETRQSTKVFSELLRERYPKTEIVYVKASLASDFRHEFGLLKARTLNDLHHGKDAYLNVVVGNVWHELFTRSWFDEHAERYSINIDTIFCNVQTDCRNQLIWPGESGLGLVKGILKKNYLHLTSYAYCQHGGLFDQNPVPAKPGLVPLKNGRPTELYGGYNKTTAAAFALVLTEEQGKKAKKELTLVAVDLMVAGRFFSDEAFAGDYVRKFVDPDMKKTLAVKFPLELKPIKIKSVFEADGLRFLLNGKSGGGRQLLISLLTPLLLDTELESYVKRLESFCEKVRKNPKLEYVEKFDKFSSKENLRFYDLLLNKLRTGCFARRPANPVETLAKTRESFAGLPPAEQAKLLLDLIGSFGRESGRGIDLKTVGGKSSTGITTLGNNLSNWKKSFKTVYLVYSDASGLHEKKSINLLDLI